MLKRCVFICHNADHEARWGIATGFEPMRYACTMVNSRRLLAGQDGYRHDLVSVIIRYLGIGAVPEWMNKDIRNTFHESTFFTTEQVLYNAGDTIRLKELKDNQLAIAKERTFELNSLRSRLVPVLAQAEMTGILHDSAKWTEIANTRQTKADEICQELTKKVVEEYGVNPLLINPDARKKAESLLKRNERDLLRIAKLKEQLRRLEEAKKEHLKGYRISKSLLEQLEGGLENSRTSSTLTATGWAINWGSTKQVLQVLDAINCPPPVKKDQKTREDKPSLGKEARNTWFTLNQENPFYTFMTSFDQFKKTIHNVNAFGEEWIKKYVRASGRVHTAYNQAGTTTGRFSCGDKDNGYPNMQQIPKGKEYRECFLADPDRAIITLDFKNCEGIIMIALSGDLNLKAISELEDSHSYLGTKCWRNVYKDRYKRTGDLKWKELSETYEMNQSTEAKKKERDIFKNSGGLFPVAYGIHASKVARSARVSEHEGQIFIDTIKAEIPRVIAFLDSKSREASTTGYVKHNNRTNSVRGFTAVLDSIHYGWKLDKSAKMEAEMAARNSPIQGTNAEVIIESIVSIDLWRRLFKQDLRLLLQVHDELVYDCPKDQVEFYADKIKTIMQRTAQKYLIPEISMGVSVQTGNTWKK